MVDFRFQGLVGSIDRHDPFPSKFVAPRIVDIWTPPGYSENPGQRYSVLYVHDGETTFDPSTSRYSHVDWGIDETITRLMLEGKIRPTIVVAIWSTDKRVLEYMPQKLPEGKLRDRALSHMQSIDKGIPISDHYLRFIIDELKPYVDRNFRTLPDRSNTFMMGSSMGGLITLYALCEYPNTFRGVACISTAFPIGRGIVLGYMQMNLPNAGNHKIYFDYGTKTLDKGYERSQQKADQIMQAHGYTRDVDWLTIRYDGHKHSEVDWRKRVNVPLEFLLGS